MQPWVDVAGLAGPSAGPCLAPEGQSCESARGCSAPSPGDQPHSWALGRASRAGCWASESVSCPSG